MLVKLTPGDDATENDRQFRRSSTSDDNTDQNEGILSIISQEAQRYKGTLAQVKFKAPKMW